MQRQEPLKTKARGNRVLGERYHVYRVVVEKARHQTVVVEATSQDEAEDKAYDIAERRPEGWVDGDMELRDCTSVRMADGSWELCSQYQLCGKASPPTVA